MPVIKKILLSFCFAITLTGFAHAQKGNKSIAAGLFVAFPDNNVLIDYSAWKTGVGIEGIGQYNFTNKSALLAQLQFTRLSGRTYYGADTYPASISLIALKGGYRYTFTPSGFYANALLGLEYGGAGFSLATLGIGKRFIIKDAYFLDAGLEYTGGFVNRIQIRSVFSLFQLEK